MSVLGTSSRFFKAVTDLPRKLIGSRNDRLVKGYARQVPPVAERESDIRGNFDARYAERCAADGIDALPAEEQPVARQRIRFECSSDLRERTAELRERCAAVMQPHHTWWSELKPTEQVQEYYKNEYRKRYAKALDAYDRDGIYAEAFAVLRESSRRAQNHRHFDCQLIGGRVLAEGKIAEMRTGEGKTIVCHLAAYLQNLCGHKVHIVTVNDYLVKRDAEFAFPIFELLGISVGYIQAQVDPGGREGVRHRAYACDITYGTNAEFGFDYLRDNMKSRLQDQVQGPLDYVVVDEVDSILIDEARTPLIISGSAQDDVSRYPRADKVAEELVRRQAVWDRKVMQTVAKFDGDTHNIPKLTDAMNVLGYKERGKSKKNEPAEEIVAPTDEDEDEEVIEFTSGKGGRRRATLGPDFLTDDHVEAIQMYEANVLQLPPAEQYRRYFIIQIERKQAGLTHDGVTIAQELLDIGSLYSGANMEWPHLIENALRAHKVYRRDTDYVVQNGQIIIVDTFTGRLMHGRQWSDGLHQAVEAKEHVVVKEETQTLATITIQNFIKLYRIKAGMTGTAMTEGTEFDKIYKLDVVAIPTNRPVNRIDHNDKMYRTVQQKFEAIVEEIHEIHRRGRPADPFLIADVLTALKPILRKLDRDTSRIDEALKNFNKAEYGDREVIRFMLETYDEMMGDLVRGRPVLVGTTSVENSEKLSKLLEQRYGIEHEVLNAKNHAREADIVAKAGFQTPPRKGADKFAHGNVTIATNMAGRGTDIKLGSGVVFEKCRVPAELPAGSRPGALYPTGVTKCCINCEEYDPKTNCAHCFKPKLDPRFPELGRKVCSLNVPCGLHIVGTERHESRRIDNQLRGRSGRQGDPGSSRFALSLQDDLLKLFMSDWMLKMMERLGFTEGTSLEDKRLNKGIERAQRKVEERNFATRKHLLEWDEPMDFQRKEFYTARQRILERRDLPELIFGIIDNTINTTVDQYLGRTFAQQCIVEWCRARLDLTIAEDAVNIDDIEAAQDSIRRKARDEAHEQIGTVIGEYIDPEDPPNKWDISGLLHWAQRAYKVSFTQNQLRKMQPQEIEDALIEAAETYYDGLNLDGIAVYLDPKYPQEALAEWARNKFAIELQSEELLERTNDDIRNLLRERIRAGYREREISYPIDAALDRAFGEARPEDAVAAEFLARWVNAKYRLNWTPEQVQQKPVPEIRTELLDVARAFHEGKLEQEVDEQVHGKTDDEAIAWARERFGVAWNEPQFARRDGDLRGAILEQGREMLRFELTRLEQFVLLRIYDQAWKDHLLEMDHLKTAIMQRPMGGDQTHPQSQYAIEGRDLFTQMWNRIANRVTDVVFKVQMPGSPGSASPTAGTSGGAVNFSHADATNVGFAAAARDQESAMRAQNVEQKVETIRREQPRVGRNDPCPCGSGKKYKQCHGRT
ncbi:MAG: SEC-C domain-containing protein [Phycisphaerae bacterium]|nr:SEC-C domain-containing protein [Phycisphaerae bacterium]